MLAGAVRVGQSGWDPPSWDDVVNDDGWAHLGADEMTSIDGECQTTRNQMDVRRAHSVLAVANRANESITKPGQFIMDSAAGVSVANELSWLNKGAMVRPLPHGACSLSGVGGDRTPVTAISGLFDPLSFMRVNHAAGSVANIISVPDLQERLYIHFRDQKTPRDRMEISEDACGDMVVATAYKDPTTRYYMLQAPNQDSARVEIPATPPASASVLNVYSDAYSRGWSKNSIARALKVRKLHRAFSYISVGRLKGLVRSNNFGDIGPKEVSLYEELHDGGDCPCCPLGKTTRSYQVALEHTRSTEVGQMIIADILEVKSKRLKANKLILVAVDDKTGYVHVKPLPKKDITSVVAAFQDISKDYKSFGWTLLAVKLDGDGAFREIAPHIACPLGIAVIPTSPYKHAVVAERMIRTLSNLFRCTLAGLPYTLAPHLFLSLVEYCASSNNLVPNDHNPFLSPTEQFTRRPPEYHKLLDIEYGKLVTFHNPSAQNDEMRGVVGVIVGRDVRRPGHAILWDLLGGGVVARNDFKPLAWNQALLKAYVDTSMGAHEAENQEVDRRVYFEPTDIELSDEDVDELCEDENAEPATLRGYEGARLASAAKTMDDSIDISRSKQDHTRALLRLIDVANASGELLESHEDDHDGGETMAERSEEKERAEPCKPAESASETCDGDPPVSEDSADRLPGREPADAATDNSYAEEDAKAELRYLKHMHLEELRKPADKRKASVIKDLYARAMELQTWLQTSGPKSTGAGTATEMPTGGNRNSFIGKAMRMRIGAIDPANLIPSRNTNGAVLTYYGVCHQVLNLSVKQAFNKLGEEDTAEALITEFLQMADKGVWQAKTKEEMRNLYRLGRVKNVLPCSIFLKEKYDADKRYIKLKARLVAHGNRQILDDLFGAKDVDSPTVSLAVVNLLLHLAAAGNWKKRVVDVAGAYLNADLKEPEYMKIPANVVAMIEARLATHGEVMQSCKQDDGSVIVELKKALYGLRQAGREWYELLAYFLTTQGYVRSNIDKCLFSKTVGGVISHLAIYVDDVLIISNSDEEVDAITRALEKRFGSITVQEGETMSFVGIEIITDAAGNTRLRQRGYIMDILNHFGVQDEQKAEYPCTGNIMDPANPSEEDCNVAAYKSGVMKLMYLSTRTRPDIAFAVSALACRAERPKVSDWDRLVHLARYLNGTKDDSLLLKNGGRIEVSAFVDASFMTHRDMRGHTGYCVFADKIGSAAILYRSVKQKSVADSSTEAEVIALHELVQHLLWITSIYEEMGIPVIKPINIHNDNRANITLNSKSIVNFKGRSKYISRKYFSVYEHVESGEVKLIWTGTDDLVADFLTKAIHGGKFHKFKIEIGLHGVEKGN